jgi:hypothetical protein
MHLVRVALKSVYWLGIVLVGIAEILVHQMDYAVPLGNGRTLYSSADRTGSFVISDVTLGQLVGDVEEYSVLPDGTVTGRTLCDLFLIYPDGKVARFTDARSWQEALGHQSTRLSRPKRADDPLYWRVQEVLGVFLALWMAGGAGLHWLARRRRRSGASSSGAAG